MSTNKLLNNLQWKTVGTVSTPDSGYKTLYAKSTDPYLYLVDDGGNEKKLGFSIYPKNGLNITSLGATYVNDYQLDIAIGTEVVIDRHHSRITVTSRVVAAVAIILASFFLNYFLK
jgi:hypothetical protein